MNKIKDFFYNKNDIIVTLIILAAAAVVIYLRVGDIMHYPDTLTPVETTATTTVATSETTAAPTATAPTEAKSITISDDADSMSVSKQLEKAGLVSSADDFEKELQKHHMAGRIRSGTFEIPANATSVEIIEIITKQEID